MSYRGKPDVRAQALDTKERAARRPYVAGASLFGLATAIGVLAPQAADAQTLQKPLLAEGANGPSVTEIQRALGTVADGDFGQRTHDQVVAFQREHGLLVDGIVGPQTRSALDQGSSQPQPPQRQSSAKGQSAASSKKTQRHSSSSSSSSYTPTSGSTSGYSIPAYIVQCESRGNYHAVNPSGAGGAYQIKPATWRAYGGSGLPQNASKDEQDAVAKRIYQAQGTAPWSCAR